MANKKTIWIIAAVFLVVLLGAAALYRPLSAPDAPALPEVQTAAQKQEDNAAPDFSMLDSNGSSVALSDYFGQPIVLNFWASWCGPCQREMPAFDAAAKAYADKVQFIMLNLTDGGQETKKSARLFIDEQGYSFPVFFDTEAAGAMAYSIRSIPATYFIDAAGNVVTYSVGAISEDVLQSGIDMITGE